jgi:tetratricopeptide (TPR) repeat protein
VEWEPSPNQYELASRLFLAALDVSAGEREEFVRRRCSADPLLADNVLRLLGQMEHLGDFLEKPAFRVDGADDGFRNGDLVGERFQVEGMLGQGGMGRVYRARDLQLGDTVALKMLHPRLQGVGTMANRFREEIRLARKIGHPNVCRIFELFQEKRGESVLVYFTMEYLEGATLADRIAKGPLVPDEALGVARQIGAGLDAAHASGILHRDLKPSNIMIVRQSDGAERVVITDFGLAKALNLPDDAAGQTVPGQIFGTPPYMAPEQFVGDEPSTATDLFALGVIVFEMVTGRNPFPTDNMMRSGMARVMGRSEPLSRYLPEAPAGWEGTIRRALAPEPERRFASAEALIAALENGAMKRPAAADRSRRKLPRRMMVAGVVVAGVAGVSGFFRWRGWGKLPANPAIMLTPLQFAAEPDGRVAGRALDLQLARQLRQSASVNVLSDDRIRQSWQRIRGSDEPLAERMDAATARHVAMRAGANYVLWETVFRKGDEWVMSLRLELAGTSPEHPWNAWDKDFRAAQEAELPEAAYAAARWVRTTVLDSSSTAPAYDRHPADLTTGSWQALCEYAAGDTAWAEHDGTAAVSHLNEALRLDPRFASAAARMGDILVALGRRDEGLPYYSRAAGIVQEKNLTDRESLRVAGMFALDTWQNEEAERIFTRYAVAYPQDGLPLFYKAGAVEALGRSEEALELSRRAAELDPDSFWLQFAYVYRLASAGRPEEAEQERRRIAKMQPSGAVDQLAAALAFARLDLRACRESLERMRTASRTEDQSKAFGLVGCLLAEEGGGDEAEKTLRDGLAFDERMGLGQAKRKLLAQLALRRGEASKAARTCREALHAARGQEEAMQIGCLFAQAGDRTSAERCLPRQLPEWPSYQHWRQRLEGELALASGRAAEAQELFRTLPRTRITNQWPEYLVRASAATGEWGPARPALETLFLSPARYFYQADYTGPGFFHWAASLARRAEISAAATRQAESLRAALTHTN